MTASSARSVEPPQGPTLPHLRRASHDDLPALVAAEHACFPPRDAWDAALFQETLEGGEIWLAEEHGALAAWLCFSRCPGVLELESLAVLPAARGRGLAAGLLRWLEGRAEGAVVRLEVADDNPRALALYAAAGYHAVERIPHFYSDGTAAQRLERRP